MNPLVSIVVPVYNCEDRIAILHKSIATQTFTDFEVIYVNDGSTDRSLEWLNKIKTSNKWVRVESHEINRGGGVTRNTGLKISRGKYLCFVDADDYIHKNYLEVLVASIERSNSDMVVCNYNSVSESGEIINTSKYRSAQYSGADSLKIFVENRFNPAPWNKIYRKELFVNNNLEFPDKIAHQDFATIPLLTERAKKITVISNVLYNYVQNPHGYSHTATDIHTYSIFKAFEIIYKHFELYSPNSLKSDLFRQIVVGRFRYNLSIRWEKFTDDQLKKYVTNFVNFYSFHDWKHHKIEAADRALLHLLKTSLIKEEYKFRITLLDSNWVKVFKKHSLFFRLKCIFKNCVQIH